MRYRVDLVIVGFGLAGAVAAIEGARRGARVVVLEAADSRLSGGNSLVSGQGILSTQDPSELARYLAALRVQVDKPNLFAETIEQIPAMFASYGIGLRKRGDGGDFVGAPGAESVQRWGPDKRGEPMVRSVQRLARSFGAHIVNSARVIALRQDRGPRTEVVFGSGTSTSLISSRYGVILACGGYTARYAREGFSLLGTPFARGDGLSLAAQLGASLDSGRAASGPYYAFKIPGSTCAATPALLYNSSASDATCGVRLVAAKTRTPLVTPSGRFHGLQRNESGTIQGQRLPPSLMIVSEGELASAALVSRWPDGHSEGWGRRYLLNWSSTNEVELRRGWIRPLDGESKRAIGIPARRSIFYVNVQAALLNTLGGICCDDRYQVLGNSGPIPGLYAAGEVVSRFRYLYQGSANLSECIISGRTAVRSAIG